jgi:hypothetical protein
MGADSVPVTAATSFISIRSYIEKTYGSANLKRVREALPALPVVVVPNARYPTALLQAMLDVAHDLLGPEDFYERCGRGIVAYEVNVFLRFVLKLGTPRGVLDKATESWRKVHSTGRWMVTGPDGAISAELIGFRTTVGYCRMLTAYFTQLLGLTGARGVTVVHPDCRGRGQPTCTFLASWRLR